MSIKENYKLDSVYMHMFYLGILGIYSIIFYIQSALDIADYLGINILFIKPDPIIKKSLI